MQRPIVPLEIKHVMCIENRTSHCSIQDQNIILLGRFTEEVEIADKETPRNVGRETSDLNLKLGKAN